MQLFIGNKWHRHDVFTLFRIFFTILLFAHGDDVVSRHKHQEKLQVATNLSYRVSVLSSSPVLLSLQILLSDIRLPCESGHSFPRSTQVAFTQEIAFPVKELFPSSVTDAYCLPENRNCNFIFLLCRHLRKRKARCYYYHVIMKTPRV